MSQKHDKMANSSRSRGLSLISPGATEDYGCHEFVHNFNTIYSPRGGPYPPFFKGTLRDAMMAGWSRPAAKLKLLVMYIHRESNPLTARFVRIFQSGQVHQLLTNNCVLWGWDISLEENERTLLKIVSENLGYDNAWRLQHCGKNMFPCFIFLSRTDKKSGVALVQFQRASADLSFAVAIFSNAVQIFMTKIRPQLISRDRKDADRSFADRSTSTPGNAEIVSHNQKGQSRNVPKGRPPRANPTDDDYLDNGESIQSLADKMVGRTADISALFDPESGSRNRAIPESPKVLPNYPHRDSDEEAKKRLAELKKHYLEAEYQRLKAEKKAIFTRILQEDLAAKNSPVTPKSDHSANLDGVDWELRKKLKHPENPKREHKNYIPPKHTFRPMSPEDLSETITIRFRSHKELFEKKFKADDTFENLLMYLSGRGYSFTEFKILAGWPRIDITGEDSRTPLKYLNFHFKDNVILAKRKTPYPYVK